MTRPQKTFIPTIDRLECRIALSATAFPEISRVQGSQEWEHNPGLGFGGEFPTFVEIADVDADGRDDVLYASQSEPRVALYKQLDGITNFDEMHLLPSMADFEVAGIAALDTADLDGDGAVDIVAAVNSQQGDHGFLLMWNVGGEFDSTTFLQPDGFAGEYNVMVVAEDFDGDEIPDVLIAGFDNVVLLRNDGDRSFATTNFGEDLFHANRDVADVDGDGDLDLLAVDTVYINDGKGNFSDSENHSGSFSREGKLLDAVFADVDGDDVLDVVTASWIAGESAVRYGLFMHSGGNYSFAGWIGTGPDVLDGGDEYVSGRKIRSGDVDGDGDDDLLIAEHGTIARGPGSIIWLENLDGNGNFGERQVIVDRGLNSSSTAILKDIDGDGRSEVIAATTGLDDTQPSKLHTAARVDLLDVRLIGDSNNDGEVEFADFLSLSANFGKNEDAVWDEGDFDGNGNVDFADFLALSANFGNERPSLD